MNTWQPSDKNLMFKIFLEWTTYRVVTQATCNMVYNSVYLIEIETYAASKLKTKKQEPITCIRVWIITERVSFTQKDF